MQFTITTAEDGAWITVELLDGFGICRSSTGIEAYGHGESTEYEILEENDETVLKRR